MTRYFASSLAMKNFVPAYPIFLIRIYFKRVPKDFLCLRVVVLFRINFCEIGQNKAVFAMARDMMSKNLLCLLETTFLHQDDPPDTHAHAIDLDRSCKDASRRQSPRT